MAARTLAENLKNQQGAVIHRQFHVALKVALLGWAQGLVKQNFCGAVLGCQQLDFVRFSAANKKRSIRRAALAGDTSDRIQACSLGEQAEFFEFAVKIGQA